MLVYRKVTHRMKIAITHLYTCVERDTVRVDWLVAVSTTGGERLQPGMLLGFFLKDDYDIFNA